MVLNFYSQQNSSAGSDDPFGDPAQFAEMLKLLSQVSLNIHFCRWTCIHRTCKSISFQRLCLSDSKTYDCCRSSILCTESEWRRHGRHEPAGRDVQGHDAGRRLWRWRSGLLLWVTQCLFISNFHFFRTCVRVSIQGNLDKMMADMVSQMGSLLNKSVMKEPIVAVTSKVCFCSHFFCKTLPASLCWISYLYID